MAQTNTMEKKSQTRGELPPLDLGGTWEFRLEEGKSIEEVGREDFAAADSMVVPGCWDVMPQWYLKRGTALYRRKFTLPAHVENAWLVVDGMGLRGDFRIDGRSLGVHPYPYARLELETGPLAAGEHVIFAALDNRFDWATMKLARPYYDFYLHGGFYHGVSLAFDNRKLFVRTRDYRTGTVEIEAVNFAERDFDATLLFDGKREVAATFRAGRAMVRVPDFRIWSPDAPNLHTVEIEGTGNGERGTESRERGTGNGEQGAESRERGTGNGEQGAAVRARFGIRQVEARDGRIFLNGEPIYLKGANRHEAHPTFGSATSETLMAIDLQNLKALGCNFVRGCHYQQSQRFLDLCDEQGILVWEESLGWGNGGCGENELIDEDFAAQQVEQTREMVRASFNHPSVIIFAFMNEFASQKPEGKALADKLIDAIRSQDSGRLVTFACNHTPDDISNANTDIVAFNTYPGWIGTDAGSPENLRRIVREDVDKIVSRFRSLYPDKPIMVSEMGTCGVYGQHDAAGAQWTEEFQAEYVGDTIDAAFANKDICGFTIWQFTDARSYHRGGATIRTKPFAQNLAGLFDGFRRPKLVTATVRERFAAKNA